MRREQWQRWQRRQQRRRRRRRRWRRQRRRPRPRQRWRQFLVSSIFNDPTFFKLVRSNRVGIDWNRIEPETRRKKMEVISKSRDLLKDFFKTYAWYEKVKLGGLSYSDITHSLFLTRCQSFEWENCSDENFFKTALVIKKLIDEPTDFDCNCNCFIAFLSRISRDLFAHYCAHFKPVTTQDVLRLIFILLFMSVPTPSYFGYLRSTRKRLESTGFQPMTSQSWAYYANPWQPKWTKCR